MSFALAHPARERPNQKLILLIAAPIIGLVLGAIASVKTNVALGLPVLAILCLLVLPRPKLGLYLVAAWVPFESLVGFGADFSATKLVAVITVFAWLIRLNKIKSSFIELREDSSICLLLFLAAAAMSLIGAEQFTIGLSHLATLAMLALLYFVIIDLIDDERSLQTMVVTLILGSTLAALIPIYQFMANGADRASGAYLDPNGSALGLVVLIPLAFAFLGVSSERKASKMLWPALFLLLVGTVITRSRGGTAALVVMIALLTADKLLDMRTRRKLIALLLILTIVITSFALFYDKRFSIEGVIATSGSGRFVIWSTGLSMFSDNWLGGVGLANYKFIYVRYAQQTPWINPEYRKPLGGHNVFIETAVETGIFGTMALIGFMLSVLTRSWRLRLAHLKSGNRRQAINSSMFAISIIGLLVACLSLGAIYMKIIWLILALSTCQGIRATRIAPQ